MEESLLFIHKYRPKYSEEYIFNKEIVKKFNKFGEKGLIPNIIFYGPQGSGKLTIVLSFLAKIFSINGKLNMSIYNRNNYNYNFEYQEKDSITINIIKNYYYFEIDADDYGYNDKKILYSFIADISNSIDISHKRYKIIIIKNADKLSLGSQYTIKRIIENKYQSIRLIFLVQNINLLDNAIKSRCLMIRIPGPTKEDMYNLLDEIAKKENINIKENQKQQILNMSGLNVSKLLLLCQYSFLNNQYEIPIDRLDAFIKDFINEIKTLNSTDIEIIRNKIYILLLHNTDIQEIYNIITDGIIKDIQDLNIIKKILKASVYYNQNCQIGYRNIYHLECYIIYIINLLNGNEIEIIEDIL